MTENNNEPKKERYNSPLREPYWQDFWDKEKIYKFDPESKNLLYTIDTPPPTISGSLHLGHVYSYAQAEVLGRFKRMAGFNVRYPFGYDDNGLPTERLVEKELGIKAQDQSLSDFRKQCLGVVKKYADEFRTLWKSIGLSVDWSLEYSTISDEVQKISQRSFKKLYEKGAIYRQEAPALYCSECRTSIAQAEVEDKELPSVFYDITFKTEGGENLTIATTRPELLPACVAVFVNPEDKRYTNLINKKIITPLGDKVDLLADEIVSIDKGSGAVMCCTFGDETDLLWVRKHKLPQRVIVSENGKIEKVNNAPYLENLSIKEARKKIVEELKKGEFITGEKDIVHNVGVHERCATPVEIIPRTQWFVKILEKKEDLLQAGEKLNWYPSYMKKRYLDWILNLKWDWCISRERFFGIPIPVYICRDCKEIILPKEEDLPLDPKEKKFTSPCPHCQGSDIEPETTVLDTWFTSSLTPEINNQHPLNGQLQGKILPMSMRPQAHDIIRTWAVYTILMSLYLRKDIPWRDLMISGHVLVKKGEKISKKTGGGKYKPQELINEHSADAIRYSMFQAGLGKDSYFEESQVEKGKKLVTKLYNSGRFVLANLNGFDPKIKMGGDKTKPVDQWILQRSNETAKDMAKEFEQYEYAKALGKFEKFFWSDFTDNYLEIIKGRLYVEGDNEAKLSAQFTIYQTYRNILKMVAPFLPHIAEEMYHSTFTKTGESVMEGEMKSEATGGLYYQTEGVKSVNNSPWPIDENLLHNEEVEEGVVMMLNIISEIRKFKSERKLKLSSPIKMTVIECGDQAKKELIAKFTEDIKSVGKLEELELILSGDKTTYSEDLRVVI